MLIEYNSTINMHDSSCTKNEAAFKGGVAYVQHSTSAITSKNCSFIVYSMTLTLSSHIAVSENTQSANCMHLRCLFISDLLSATITVLLNDLKRLLTNH